MPDPAPATPFGLPLMASGGGRANIDAWRQYMRARSSANATLDRLNLQYMSKDPSYGIFAGIKQGASDASTNQGFGGSGRIANLKARPGLIRAQQSYMDSLQNTMLGLQNAGFGYDQTQAQSAMNAVDYGYNNPGISPDADVAAIKRTRRRLGL